jgi:hypothetical protein
MSPSDANFSAIRITSAAVRSDGQTWILLRNVGSLKACNTKLADVLTTTILVPSSGEQTRAKDSFKGIWNKFLEDFHKTEEVDKG